ncbi:carbonic anhydrase [Frondihabitans sp. PAMC 28766]|uniref:carbonic anhydrase n=1 Tax=Frondihabitans sp. PAMC 28766 TaxID=1795630 RepID=UPI00078C1B1D|nr:carbonic anhydrase [Frondihabitans sp. PAMC 28766]AMM21023.1 carbonic anhydrase [Frondihabitans sp. PAMC 28766]
MNNSEALRTANTQFAQTDLKKGVPQIPFVPNKQVYVITCIDPRVDPSDVFELTLGDAIVARSVGGRVTQAVLDDMAWISYLHETKTPDADWFEVMVMHHTDCGSGLMADAELRAGFVKRGFDGSTLVATAVTNPADTVPGDVNRILQDTHLSGDIRVSGWSYDIHTGIATQLVAPHCRNGQG